MPRLPWETPLPWETATPNDATTGQAAAPPVIDPDDGNPFGEPIDGRRVLAYLAEPLPLPTAGGILAVFTGTGAPKTRRQAVIESLENGIALAGAASDVGLRPVELQAAITASPGLARAVEIAMHKGDKANVGDGSGLSRWRFARTGNADKPEDGGDASGDLLELQNRLRAILDPATGGGLLSGVPFTNG